MKYLPIALLAFVFATVSAAAQAPQPPPTPPSGPAFVSPAPSGPGAATPPPVTAANAAAEEAAPEAATSVKDQTDVAITIYNTNLALVRDRRKISLPTGEHRLQFMDVAQQIKPETVSLQSVSTPGSIRILEQNYEYDLISPSKLMEKYIGKQVKLVNFSTEVGFSEKQAELMSVNEGAVFKVGNDIYLGHPGTVVLPELPANLVARPSLIWRIENDAAAQEIEAAYLTQGVRWNADYVATLTRTETKMDLNGWVTLVNESGAQYTNAKLKLVAGDVNVVQPPMPMEAMAMDSVRALRAPMPQMKQEAFGEYHLYTLERRTTIKENQSKQVSLLSASNVGVQKLYEFRGDVNFYMQIIPPMKDQKVEVFLKFKNAEQNSLGVPLPAGTIRVYQQDSEGMLQFTGEDRIEHTPKDEEIRLKLGNAFDVVGERTQTDYKRIADTVYEASFEIKIRNHKATAITVDVMEPMTSDWAILESSHPSKKKDAQTAVFPLPVPADGETVLTYRVRVRY